MTPSATDRHPRVLILAANEISPDFSTGITIANLYRNWPKDRLVQICLIRSTTRSNTVTVPTAVLPGQGGLLDEPIRWALRQLRRLKATLSLQRPMTRRGPARFGVLPAEPRPVHNTLAAILEVGPVRIDRRTQAFVRRLNPDVIYSPMSGIRMMRLAERLHSLTGAPVVPHFMDDWPTTLYEHRELGGYARKVMLPLLERTLRNAPAIAVISDAMAEEFRRRYDVTAVPVMNCVDGIGSPKDSHEDTRPVRFAYVGGLHLGRAALLREIASAIEETTGAELHIHAPQQDLERHRSLFDSYTSVQFGPTLSASNVPRTLSEADVLVHLESFDDSTVRYTRLSISTKIPQYLAAARPVLAIGPPMLASIQHLHNSGAAIIVNEMHRPDMTTAINRLTDDQSLRYDLSQAAASFAKIHHSAHVVQSKLLELLTRAGT